MTKEERKNFLSFLAKRKKKLPKSKEDKRQRVIEQLIPEDRALVEKLNKTIYRKGPLGRGLADYPLGTNKYYVRGPLGTYDLHTKKDFTFVAYQGKGKSYSDYIRTHPEALALKSQDVIEQGPRPRGGF